MVLGQVPVVRQAMGRAGLAVANMDVIQSPRLSAKTYAVASD